MEHGRLNRPCVIPDYGGAELKALLRDPPRGSVVAPPPKKNAPPWVIVTFLVRVALKWQTVDILSNSNQKITVLKIMHKEKDNYWKNNN